MQSVYNPNGFIGVITELQQVFLAIYDTDIIPFSYTGSENIDITDNQISLNLPININNEIVLQELGRGDDTVGNPRRAQTSQLELFELVLLLKLNKQLPVEHFGAAASQSTVPFPPS